MKLRAPSLGLISAQAKEKGRTLGADEHNGCAENRWKRDWLHRSRGAVALSLAAKEDSITPGQRLYTNTRLRTSSISSYKHRENKGRRYIRRLSDLLVYAGRLHFASQRSDGKILLRVTPNPLTVAKVKTLITTT